MEKSDYKKAAQSVGLIPNEPEKKLPKWITPYNYDWTAQSYEENSGEIVTIPDDSYTIAEIMRRAIEGLDVPIKHGYYNDSDDFEDTDEFVRPDFDLTDAQRIQKDLETKADLSQKQQRQPKQKTIDEAIAESKEAIPAKGAIQASGSETNGSETDGSVTD